jgi:PAS domain S-box-containing protein
MSSYIDLDRIEELRSLDDNSSGSFLKELLVSYLNSNSKCLKLISDSLSANDLYRARQEAHSLRSTSLNLGISAVANACANIEYAPETADFKVLFLELENESLKAYVALQQYLQSQHQDIEHLSKIIQIQQDIATTSFELPDVMKLICLRTQELTGATGAVVEIAEADEMVYQACSGSVSQHLGLRLKSNHSLSGESFLKNQILYCQDTETDPRVDREACRKVGARSMICVPLVDAGNAIGVLKVVSNVSEKFSKTEINLLQLVAGFLSSKIAQANNYSKLISNERKYRTLVESANDAIIISKNGIMMDVNPAFERMFQYPRKDAIGMTAEAMVPESERAKVGSKIRNELESAYQHKAQRKDGTIFEVEATAKTIEMGAEKIRVTTVRDITAQKMVEMNLIESEKKSREATKAKSQFLANMSHEIRTPLNAIMGMSSILLETPLNPEQTKFAQILASSTESLLHLIDDILDFSKIEAGKLSLEETEFEIRPLLNEIHSLFVKIAHKKNLSFFLEIEKEVPEVVVSDPRRIRQVIVNLVSNGIKYTDKGEVRIIVGSLNGSIHVKVIDTGIGISKDYLPKLFIPFTQADASNTRRFGGTGLGLSICAELVDLLGGKMGVDSVPNCGSTFWFSFPFKTTTFKAANEIIVSGTNSSNELKILLVEDNETNSLIGKLILEKIGHHVEIAENGIEALKKLEHQVFDVIFMDCQMPVMDGYETTAAIRNSSSQWSSIPIIAMTANAMKGDREKCLAAGMDEYISKPLKKDDLKSILNALSLQRQK